MTLIVMVLQRSKSLLQPASHTEPGHCVPRQEKCFLKLEAEGTCGDWFVAGFFYQRFRVVPGLGILS